MSVLIKGMEMPTEQYGKMVITLYPNGHVAEYIGDIGRVWEAVPVPPHGKLGDLDDFAKRMKSLVEKAENDGFDLGTVWYSTFVRHIELTPAIIPASGED